jgi:formate dehydrogenase gamma subunit
LPAFASGETADNSDCFLCHDDPGWVREEGPDAGALLHVDPVAYGTSVHGEMACTDCHSSLDPDEHPDGERSTPVQCGDCHAEQTHSYGMSVHFANGDAPAEDGLAHPGCSDCHGVHDILPKTDLRSPLNFLNQIETCGECHGEVTSDLRESVHGNLGSRDTPICTDCHREHAVQPLSEAAAMKASGEVCSQCHASERLSSRYGLSGDTVSSFYQSYHGLATKLGSRAVANCASCHGYHLILPQDDPRSTIHPDRLAQTCGECHPGASDKFASGDVHHPAAKPGEGDFGAVVNYWVGVLYKALIFIVIGLMIAHNGLAWRRSSLRHMRNPKRKVVRMGRQLRIQHALLALSFIYLAISGFALAYPGSVMAWMLGGSEPFRRWSHRIVGVFMLLLGIYHLIYLAVSPSGRRLVRDLLPSVQDARDMAQNLHYFLGTRTEKARFGRFGYPEKIEYWAVLWGSVIMGVSGLVIWLKLPVTEWLPRWVVDVATTVHFYEAVLAVLAIIIWHFYHVIFDPATYPMNWSWMDGKVTREWLEHEHPEDDTPPDKA